MESSYVSEFADERKTFDRLLDSHFRRVEERAGTWDQERALLQNKIDQKTDELREKQRKIAQLESRNASSTGLEAVVREKEQELDEKRDTIRKLERQLREAQNTIAELREEENIRRKRALRPTADRSLENKENISDAGPNPLEVEMTSPRKPNRPRPAQVDSSTQSDKLEALPRHNDSKYEKMEQRAKDAEDNLAVLQKAFDKLKEQREKDKKVFKAWVAEDEGRRAKKMAAKQEAQPFLELTSDGKSDIPRSSPLPKPRLDADSDAGSVRSRGLFSKTKTTVPSRAMRFDGTFPRSNEPELRPTTNLPPDRSSSPPETAMEEDPNLPVLRPSTRKLVGDDQDQTAEGSEAYNQEGSPTPKSGKVIKPDPSNSPKTPVGTRTRRTTAGTGAKDSPLIIKSEPDWGDSGPGYHIFNDDDDDDLDLDDVPAPRPRGRKRKSQQSQPKKTSPKKASPKKKRASPKSKAPLAVREGYDEHAPLPDTVQTDNVEDAASRTGELEKPEEDEHEEPGTRTPYTSRRRNAGDTSSKSTGPLSASRKAKRKRGTYDVTASVLEDGTDALGNSYHHHNEPAEIDTPVKVKDLLSTPAPKLPSLAHLKEAPIIPHISTEPPPKKRAVFTPEGVVSRSSTTTPTTARNSNRESKTDPPKPKKSIDELVSLGTSGYIPVPSSRKRPSSAETMPAPPKPVNRKLLTSSDFRINPLANDGVDYAYSEVVRGKEKRKCLPGCTKACCRDLSKFIAAAGLPMKSKGLQWSEEEESQGMPEGLEEQTERFTDQYGKHRDRFGGRERSPMGFWDSDFPDTQKLKAQREDADRREAEKVERRKREAEKGEKGRYTYKSM